MTCLFNPVACVHNAALAAIWAIPLWGWAIGVVVALIIAWRLGGIAGLVAAAGAIGYAFGRTRVLEHQDSENVAADSPDAIPPHRKRPTVPVNRPGTWNAREGRWN